MNIKSPASIRQNEISSFLLHRPRQNLTPTSPTMQLNCSNLSVFIFLMYINIGKYLVSNRCWWRWRGPSQKRRWRLRAASRCWCRRGCWRDRTEERNTAREPHTEPTRTTCTPGTLTHTHTHETESVLKSSIINRPPQEVDSNRVLLPLTRFQQLVGHVP